MVELRFSLIKKSSKLSEEILFTIPKNEWAVLVKFHEKVEILKSTKFIQNERRVNISVSQKFGEKLVSKSKPLEMEEVWAMFLKLRPFVLQKESLYFHNIKNNLKKSLRHPSFQNEIVEIEDSFMLRRLNKKLQIQGSGRLIFSEVVVMDWLNSFEYHAIETKRMLVEKDLGFFGEDHNGLPIILVAIIDMVNAILGLSNVVETLLEIEKGKLKEVLWI